MRLNETDNKFKNWLLNIGIGKGEDMFEIENSVVKITPEILSSGDLIGEIFGSEINNNDNTLKEKVILAPTNDEVFKLNQQILERLNGVSTTYHSIDSISNENNMIGNSITIEFLNSLTPNGLPPHILKLKIGAIVMLLRNLNLEEGLCNGTRLIIKELKNYVIKAQILTGTHTGKTVFIPRIDLSPSKEELPFEMVRRQFPIRLGFSITINKSQGQTFNKVGLYLPIQVFSHGQLYVALSRVTNKKNLKILVSNSIKKKQKINNKITEDNLYIKNIVYKEIFEQDKFE